MQQEPKITGTTKYLQVYRSKPQIMLDNFLGGISWSFGTFLGLATIAIIAGFIIHRINLVPIIGTWLAQILQDATSKIQSPIK